MYGCYIRINNKQTKIEKGLAQYDFFCVTDGYAREMINMFLISQVSWLVEKLEPGFFSDTINVIDVKLCMVVLLIGHYLLTPFSGFLSIVQGYSCIRWF